MEKTPGFQEFQSSYQPKRIEAMLDLPISTVNFHVIKSCNMHCAFCFATFQDIPRAMLPAGHLNPEDAFRVVDKLAEAGFRKINFAGGEPFLHSRLPDLLARSKANNMVTSTVTNGDIILRRGPAALEPFKDKLDIITVSIDSLNPETLNKTGRVTGKGAINEDGYRQICKYIHDAEIALKINTVVTAANWSENMGRFIAEVQPIRWKIFQVMGVEGQNSDNVNSLLIGERQFRDYLLRQKESNPGVNLPLVAETAYDMTDSYIMVDPSGRFYNSGTLQSEYNINDAMAESKYTKYRYSQPILEVGVAIAIQQVFSDLKHTHSRFLRRGGEYGVHDKYEAPVGTMAAERITDYVSNAEILAHQQSGIGGEIGFPVKPPLSSSEQSVKEE